ncbi:MAG: hypothetical protein ACOXZ9_03285 [Bacteroidales bacterium]|jgi:uncharacterized protein YcfL
MKNLSFLISLTVAVFLLFSCSNNKNIIKSENQSAVEKPLIDSVATSTDTAKVTISNAMTNEMVTKKDSLNKNTKYSNKGNKEIKEAPKHNSPNQTKIDSIKKAKEKLKK